MRLLTGILLIVVVVCAASLSLLLYKKVAGKEIDKSGIVRLVDIGTGQTFCTGVVINSNTIVTAAHCTAYHNPFYPGISVRGEDNRELHINPTRMIGNQRADFAVLKGDFSIFKSKKLVQNAEQINAVILDQDRRFVQCGYAYGGSLVCSSVNKISIYGFLFKGSSFIYPGMSGGPLFDISTNEVPAIGVAAEGNFNIYAPLVNIIGNLGAF